MTVRRRRLAIVVLAALLLLSRTPSVPAAAAGPPQSRPSRIVSLIPAVTEMLFVIGAGPQVVAVSSFDEYPPQVKMLPRVGALLDPDLERILSLRPDLVVVYESQGDLRRQLERAGVPMYIYKHAGLPDVLAKRLAKESGIDIGRIAGSGPHGRVIARDVDAAKSGKGLKAAPGTPAAVPTAPATAPSMSDQQVRALFEEGSYEVVPHDGMRRTIAQRLTQSTQTIPHFYLTIDCNIGKLLAAREEINAAAPKDKDGRPRKMAFGGWMLDLAFPLMARMKGLRGGPLDLFGRTEERRMERGLIADYELTLDRLVGGLIPERLPLAARIAAVPQGIRGYGHIKDASVVKAKAEAAALWAQWEG